MRRGSAPWRESRSVGDKIRRATAWRGCLAAVESHSVPTEMTKRPRPVTASARNRPACRSSAALLNAEADGTGAPSRAWPTIGDEQAEPRRHGEASSPLYRRGAEGTVTGTAEIPASRMVVRPEPRPVRQPPLTWHDHLKGGLPDPDRRLTRWPGPAPAQLCDATRWRICKVLPTLRPAAGTAMRRGIAPWRNSPSSGETQLGGRRLGEAASPRYSRPPC